MSPIRCTQNPSMGEEWRRGWHPEHYRPRHADERVLVVGAGPAGLEAAMALGKRGCEVVLVERSRTLGGRVAAEARLPGLAEWIRVVDYRLGQISRLDNVEHYLESEMTVGGSALLRLRPRRGGHRLAVAPRRRGPLAHPGRRPGHR